MTVPEHGRLTCAICGWKGHDVGQHAAKRHGIKSRDYRRLHGPTTSAWLSGVRTKQYTRQDPFGLGRWSRELVIDALRAWAAEHGRTPRAMEWRHAGDAHPSASTVKNRFGNWAAAVEAAGLPPVSRRRQTHCKRGHPLEEGVDACPICVRTRNRERYQRKRDEIRAYQRERYARLRREQGLAYEASPSRRRSYRPREDLRIDPA